VLVLGGLQFPRKILRNRLRKKVTVRNEADCNEPGKRDEKGQQDAPFPVQVPELGAGRGGGENGQ